MRTLRSELMGAAESIRAGATARAPWLAGARLAGIGWATVELERAARELDPIGEWTPAPRDAHLGASCWRHLEADDASDATAGGSVAAPPALERPALLLLEPDTEGRLAGSLARFGEGVAAIYLVATHPPSHLDGSDAAGVGAVAEGPLGRGHVLLRGAAWGPHVVVLEETSAP